MAKSSSSPSLYWLHCNRCFEQYNKKRKRFTIMSCQHVLCETCVANYVCKNNDRICPYCRKSVKCREICSGMGPEAKKLFHPRPWEDLSNISYSIPFQLKQRRNFFNGLKKAEEYAENQKAEVQKLIFKNRKLSEVLQKLSKLKGSWEEAARKYRRNECAPITELRRNESTANCEYQKQTKVDFPMLFNTTKTKSDEIFRHRL